VQLSAQLLVGCNVKSCFLRRGLVVCLELGWVVEIGAAGFPRMRAFHEDGGEGASKIVIVSDPLIRWNHKNRATDTMTLYVFRAYVFQKSNCVKKLECDSKVTLSKDNRKSVNERHPEKLKLSKNVFSDFKFNV
jgi:hypothetical protein